MKEWVELDIGGEGVKVKKCIEEGNIQKVKVLKEEKNIHVIEKYIQKIEENDEVLQVAIFLLILIHIHHLQNENQNQKNKIKNQKKLKIN